MLGSCSSLSAEGCPVPPRFVSEGTNSALAPLLTASIHHSRKAALHAGAHPVPESIRTELEPHFDEETLEAARWTISQPRLTLDALVVEAFPRFGAMTFDEVIVFRSAADAADLSLWAHELVHVEQFRRAGGVAGFAHAYLGHWPDLEAEAVARTNGILAAAGSPMRQSHRAQPGRCV
jgi:hypothetical protein